MAGGKVLDGEFKDKSIVCMWGKVCITFNNAVFSPRTEVYLDSNTVAGYKLVDYSSDVSMTSAVTRSLVGRAVAGNAGGLAGVMSAKVNETNVVLITYRDGRKSLIEIDELSLDTLKRNCKYNINIDGKSSIDNNFDIHKEIKCPHCGTVVLGAADENCPVCKRSYSIPKKKWRGIDIAIIFFLIIFPPIGIAMMWINKSFYDNTRVKLTIIFTVFFVFVMYWGFNSNINNDVDSGYIEINEVIM